MPPRASQPLRPIRVNNTVLLTRHSDKIDVPTALAPYSMDPQHYCPFFFFFCLVSQSVFR